MNKLFKIFISTLLILSINIHAVFTGAKLIRNKKTGGYVSLWDETHRDDSVKFQNTFIQRAEMFNGIEAFKADNQDVFVGVEDSTVLQLRDVNIMDTIPQHLHEILVGAEKSVEKAHAAFSFLNDVSGAEKSPLVYFIAECMARGIPSQNSEVRKLYFIWLRLIAQGLIEGDQAFQGIVALQRIERAKYIKQLNSLPLAPKMKSLIIEHIYQSQPELINHICWDLFDHKRLDLISSLLYQVDFIFVLQCLKQAYRDHIFLLGGFKHTEAVYKLLLESGEYEPVATFGLQDVRKVEDSKVGGLEALDIKTTFAEIQEIIRLGKKCKAATIIARL